MILTKSSLTSDFLEFKTMFFNKSLSVIFSKIIEITEYAMTGIRHFAFLTHLFKLYFATPAGLQLTEQYSHTGVE